MSKLLDLMKRLGKDANLEAEYLKNPRAVAARAGLSEEETDALVNKDYVQIKTLTGLEDGQFATNASIRAYDN
ncbi:MAG TPA: hypothetical protein DDZ76_13170 [Xanthomonadales bacterium]|nr:hypothetical protein [Xanthomonadales bacterium]